MARATAPGEAEFLYGHECDGVTPLRARDAESPHLPVASPRFQNRPRGPSVPLRASAHIAICRRGRGLHNGLMMRRFLIQVSAQYRYPLPGQGIE